MVTALLHSIIRWEQMAVLEPINEGLERISRAHSGINLHSIDFPHLSWSARAIHLLSGVALILPGLNLIVWVFMRTLGNAPILSQAFTQSPFYTWTQAKIEVEAPIIPHIEQSPPTAREQPLHVNEFKTIDQIKNDPPFEANWKMETYTSSHIINRTSTINSFKSVYSLNWDLQEGEFKNASTDIKIIKKHHVLHISGTKQGKQIFKEFPLTNHFQPWIQEPNGFRPFVQSERQEELHFYAVDPRNVSLCEITVNKTVVQDHPKYGKIVGLTTKFKSGILSFKTLGETWHRLQTGEIVSYNYSFWPITWGNSKLLLPS